MLILFLPYQNSAKKQGYIFMREIQKERNTFRKLGMHID